jgi:rhodanese-related sulfurtransferase
MIKQLTAHEAQALLHNNADAVMLDVREPWELQLAALNLPFIHMPMQSVSDRLSELPLDGSIICVCHHGMRSQQVAYFLSQQGFESVFNLSGGIDAWANTVDHTVQRY